MRANASELGISPDHIAVTGNSAVSTQATTPLLVAYRPSLTHCLRSQGGHLSLLVAGVDGEL